MYVADFDVDGHTYYASAIKKRFLWWSWIKLVRIHHVGFVSWQIDSDGLLTGIGVLIHETPDPVIQAITHAERVADIKHQYKLSKWKEKKRVKKVNLRDPDEFK